MTVHILENWLDWYIGKLSTFWTNVSEITAKVVKMLSLYTGNNIFNTKVACASVEAQITVWFRWFDVNLACIIYKVVHLTAYFFIFYSTAFELCDSSSEVQCHTSLKLLCACHNLKSYVWLDYFRIELLLAYFILSLALVQSVWLSLCKHWLYEETPIIDIIGQIIETKDGFKTTVAQKLQLLKWNDTCCLAWDLRLTNWMRVYCIICFTY